MAYKLKYSCFFVLLVFFFAAPLFSDPFNMISAGDPLLEDIRAILRWQGKSFVSLTPPLSRDEILSVLDTVDPDSLPRPLQLRYEHILGSLFPPLSGDYENFAFAVHAKAALEGRLRSNNDVPWFKKDNTSQAVLALPVHFFFADRIALFFEPAVAGDPSFYNNPVRSWGANVPVEAEQFDMNVPLTAYLAAGCPWWSFQLGRDKLSFGPGRTGNLAISGNPDFYDFARLSFNGKNFKYSFFISQMPLSLESRGKSLVDTKPSVYQPNPSGGDLMETTNRYLYVHRLDFRFFQKLSVGISEGVMVGNSPLELRYLNPMMIFHSLFSWKDYPEWGSGDLNGSLFSLDIEWAFLRGWALYGQIVMNEYSTPYETNNFPDQPPSGMGYLLGTEYVHVISDWIFSWYAELVYTEPFLYLLSSPFGSMIWMRRTSDLGKKDLRYLWFGHKEGRDMFLAAVGVSARTEKLALSLDINVKFQGQHGMIWDWTKADNTQRSPSGNPETTARAIFGIQYRILSALTVSGYLGGTAIFDAGHTAGNREYGIETGLSASYRF